MPSKDDSAMDGLLARAMRAAQGPESGCDAELAAAYIEGRLSRSERERLEGHLTRCTACRALTAAMLEESAPPPAPTPVRAAWRWRWAVPALASLAVVGSVVYFQRDRIETQPADQRPAVVARQAEPPPPAAEPAKPVQPAPARRSRQRRDEPPQEGAVAPAPVASALRDAAPAAPPRPPMQEKVETALAEERPQALRLREQDTAANRISAKAALPLAPLPEGAPLRAMVRRDVSIWAVSDGGRIFRSSDAGRTWEKLESPTTTDLVRVTWESESSLMVEDRDGNQYRLKP